MPSLQHRFLALVIPRIRRSSDAGDPERERREKIAEQTRADTSPPRRLTDRLDVRPLDGYAFPVHDLRPRGAEPVRSVLYLHGGGYVGHVDRAHWRYVARLVDRFGFRVVLPVYPLAPRHTWRDSHPAMRELFTRLAVESPGGVTLMGDSAGGGYALALAQQLRDRPGPQPTHLVLNAPWVDLTGTTTGTEEAATGDPWLRLSRLHLYGGWWAGGDDPARPEVSPLFGDMAGLPPMLVWSGTADLLCPQSRELVRRAREAGVDVTYVEEPGLLHVYPILPIPEARRAFAQLEAFL